MAPAPAAPAARHGDGVLALPTRPTVRAGGDAPAAAAAGSGGVGDDVELRCSDTVRGERSLAELRPGWLPCRPG